MAKRRGKKIRAQFSGAYLLVVVEVTGLAPVYQRKTIRLSSRTVYFRCRNGEIANQLAVVCVEKNFKSKRFGVTAETLFALSYTVSPTTQRRSGLRADVN